MTAAQSGLTSKRRGLHTNRTTYRKYLLVRTAYLVADLVMLVPIVLAAVLSRLAPRPVDVGIGPLPTINSRYHKRCLERYGYRCETFVYQLWYLTDDFDVNIGRACPRAFGPYVSFLFVLFRYHCLYTYFSGGPLGFTTLLGKWEPFLLSLAGIKTVVMPFGGDVHELSRSKNLLVVDAYAKDYPGFRNQRKQTASLIDAWTRGADHIISGCDWVDYLYYWDTLMLSHFAIDTDALVPADAMMQSDQPCRPLRLIHAPNHRALKGTEQLVRAVDELRADGLAVELTIVEGVPNQEIPALIDRADVVVDQFVLGWYAMFAIEAMALGKPVVCHIRAQYRDLYVATGLLEPDELPLIDCSIPSIKQTLRHLAALPACELHTIGLRSRAFVEKHHSIDAIGATFDRINKELAVPRSLAAPVN